ncbi:putative sensorory transduction protein, containing AAA ATPase domain, TPR repeats domain, GGDEF domain and GAF domain [Marinobacterium lacunae]|uniref:diguanylate cyclase n=1 Tax=Marinobacterium lacunae TaxID=1232683 RepID=A0A081FYA1_9GAMM|nr:diguanylate cyclase [Marinobacterium lacunae]KEA63506.1 putative sensorory transduction protein, containing AAA ATPase domain, TPR repeats domain, GGDEF domain and GAF domain [Marinobacterium lacunae]
MRHDIEPAAAPHIEGSRLIVKRTELGGWLMSLGFIGAWLAVWALGLLVEYTSHASVWFPAAGMTFAGLLVVGSRIIPHIMFCAVISTLWTNYQYQLNLPPGELLVAGLVFGVAHITPYYLGTRILRYLADQRSLQLFHLIISFLLIAALSSLLTVFSVLQGLILTDMMPADDLATTWFPFWIGDMAGVLVIAPLFVSLLTLFYPTPKFWVGSLHSFARERASDRFGWKLALSAVLLLATLLLAAAIRTQEAAFAIFFMIIPQMWITYTESPVRTVISVAMGSFLIALGINLLGLMDYVMVYQFAINVIAASAFFGLSVPTLIADNQQLRKRVQEDGLTGAASRQFLLSQSMIELQRCARDEQPFSLIVLDLDDFKAVNDRFGHVIGDKALIAVCDRIRNNLRATDTLGRYGGDEFVILLPATALPDALKKAEQIRTEVLQITLTPELRLSCSFGVAEADTGDAV